MINSKTFYFEATGIFKTQTKCMHSEQDIFIRFLNLISALNSSLESWRICNFKTLGLWLLMQDMQLQLWHHVSRSNRLPSIAALLQQHDRTNGFETPGVFAQKKLRELMFNLNQYLWYNFSFWSLWHLKDQNRVYVLRKRYFLQNAEFKRCLKFFSGVLTSWRIYMQLKDVGAMVACAGHAIAIVTPCEQI